MPSINPYLKFVIDRQLLKQIDKYQHRREFKTRAAAIKWLIKWALRHDPPPPDPDELG